MLNYKKKTDQTPLNNNTDSKELKVSDLTNIEKMTNSEKNTNGTKSNDLNGGGKHHNYERYIQVIPQFPPMSQYPQFSQMSQFQQFPLSANPINPNPSFNRSVNPLINPSIHQLSDSMSMANSQLLRNQVDSNFQLLPNGANIQLPVSRLGLPVSKLGNNIPVDIPILGMKQNLGQDMNLIDVNSIIVETNTQLKKFIFFDRLRNYLGSFTVHEFIRCLTINIDPLFLSGIECDTSRPVIEKFIAKIKTDDQTKKQSLILLNYLESPFMGNVELLIKFYSYINEFEQNQYENELSKIQLDNRPKIKSVIDNMIYVLLNHILKIIGAISSKLQNNKNKDSLLNYSVAIVYRLSKYVHNEIDRGMTSINDLKSNLAKIESTKNELNTRLDAIQRTIEKQNTEIELVLKNILMSKALGTNIPQIPPKEYTGGSNNSNSSVSPSSHSSHSSHSDTPSSNSTQYTSEITTEQSRTDTDNFKNIYSSKDDESMIYSASNPTSHKPKNKLQLGGEVHSFEDMLMSHTSNASNYEEYSENDNKKINLKVKKHKKHNRHNKHEQTQLEYISESPAVSENVININYE